MEKRKLSVEFGRAKCIFFSRVYRLSHWRRLGFVAFSLDSLDLRPFLCFPGLPLRLHCMFLTVPTPYA